MPELEKPVAVLSVDAEPNSGPALPAPATMVQATPPAGTCPACSGSSSGSSSPPPRASGFIYALGRIEPRFPRISVEKEFAQATGRSETAGLSDRQTLHKVLSESRNRYLARQLCWVMTISGLETYIVFPRQAADLDLLVETLRPAPDAGALDAVIGTQGPIAPPDMCNGLSLPIVIFDQLYSFDRESLLKSIPSPKKGTHEFAAAAADVLDRILGAIDNAGASDGHRALNYLAVRDSAIYTLAAESFARDLSLTAIDTRPWRLSSARTIVEVVFTFTQRKNEFVEKFCTRVDVNDEFPFLVSKMAPYFDH
jgi:PatG Domain